MVTSTPGAAKGTLDADRDVPSARELLPADAPRDAWLAARRAGIGGSDSSTLLGFNPYGSRIGLWLDKTGRWVDDRDSEAMERGRWLEPYIRDRFTWQTGIAVRECGLLQSVDHPLALFTPDGLTADGGVLEIKTTTFRNAGLWDDDEVADHAELQVQHGLGVTGLNHGWVAVSIDGKFPLIRRVERDDVIITAIFTEIEHFWTTYVEADQAPALTGGGPESAAVRAWWPVHTEGSEHVITEELSEILEEWRHHKAAESAAKRAATDLDARARVLVGAAEYVMPEAGPTDDEDRPAQPLATLRANGTFAASRFGADEPELAAEFVKKVEVLDVDALKAARPDMYAKYRARVLRVANKPFDLYRKGA